MIKSPTNSQSRAGTSFEDRVLKHLNDLTNAQKSSEERQFLFEKHIEEKLNSYMKDHQSRIQGPSRLTQNQEPYSRPVHGVYQRQHLEPARSIHGVIHRQYQEPARTVHDAIEDFDDFEEFDQNFPIKKLENVEDLEYTVRKDLEFKFLLVNLFFAICSCFVCKTFSF